MGGCGDKQGKRKKFMEKKKKMVVETQEKFQK